ncbi:MAG TPA: protein kinase, partial [Gemmatimonadales bacterium]
MADIPAQLADALRDRYVLQRELGRGGMATVYLARDLKHDRPVALKVLRPELAATVGPDRFRREIQLAARLQHPHILTVHDSGDANGQLWFTMPYVEGENLRARLSREGQLPLDAALRITREAAQALQYAHEQGVIHRDIKPENLLLTPDGNTLVADFGIARAIGAADGAQERLTETGLSIGTPRYMSPEQASGDRAVDARADIYSLGCVLYEMLAGHPPFHGATAHEILARHALDPVPPLRAARDTIPPAIEQTVVRALAKSPADRFPTAARFAEALATPDQTLPIRPTVAPPARRVPKLAVAAAVTVGLIALVAAYAWWPRPVVKLDPDLVAVLPFRVSGAAPTLDYLREGMIDLAAAKLSGEAGARAADPRSVMSAWRHVAGSHRDDLSERASLDLARRLGAGQLLLGGVVGTPDHLVLNASLVAVLDGKTLTKATVEGAADSLPVLVDRLLAQLIAGETGGQRGRTGLVNTPLPALRAYLEGQAAYRRGEYGEAVAHFDRALELDSTFGLAGLALAAAAGWANAPGAARRGLEHAWAGRERLSPRDRALLVAEAGPHYPVPSSLAEYLAAWEQAVDLAPDQPDRWYELGDVYFHDGPYLRIAASQQ